MSGRALRGIRLLVGAVAIYVGVLVIAFCLISSSSRMLLGVAQVTTALGVGCASIVAVIGVITLVAGLLRPKP